MLDGLLRIIAIGFATSLLILAWLEVAVEATPGLQPGTSEATVHLEVTPGATYLDAEWELSGISEFQYMSIQWRVSSTESWERYASPRVSFHREKERREFTVDYIPAFSDELNDWFNAPLSEDVDYQIRVWVEFSDTTFVISNVIEARIGEATPTSTMQRLRHQPRPPLQPLRLPQLRPTPRHQRQRQQRRQFLLLS